MNGHADRPPLVGQGARDGLADPPGRIGGELEALAVVELLGRAHEPDRSLLDQVEEGQALVAIPLGDGDDEAQVGLHHRLLGAVVAALDPLRELDLLGSGQERNLADVLEEELQRVGGDLALLVVGPEGRERRLGGDDLDVQLLQGAVEVVRLGRSRSMRSIAATTMSALRLPSSRAWSSSSLVSSESNGLRGASTPLERGSTSCSCAMASVLGLRGQLSHVARTDERGRTAYLC